MTNLIISEPLASRIREIAQRDHLTPDEVVSVLFERHYPAPRPEASLTDADIDVPKHVDDAAAYRAAARALAPKLYRIARRYWQVTGDTERLALTDEELDKLFWLIDDDGVPRLKSEQGAVEIRADPLDSLIGLIESSDPDLSRKSAEYR